MRSVKTGLMAAGVGMALNMVLAIVKIVISMVVWTGLKISALPAD
jgi:hypothetical protein